MKRASFRISKSELNMLNWCAYIFSRTKVQIIDAAERAYNKRNSVAENVELETTTQGTPFKYSGNLEPMVMRRALVAHMTNELTAFFGGELPEIPPFKKEKD